MSRPPLDPAGPRAALDRALGSAAETFGDFFLIRFLGAAITYGEDTCQVAFDAAPHLFNPQGTLHGGVLATAMDVSMGHLLHRHGGAGTTLEFKVQFTSAVRGGTVTCTGRFLRQGRTVCFVASTATDDAGREVAHATATWMRLATPG
jgi:uncharacterized protein (TIGR00369 family)